MTLKQSLQRVEREQERTALALRTLTARTEHLVRLSRQVHPLLLIGSAFLVGLLGGRLIGRARLPDKRIPALLLSPPMQKLFGGLVEKLFAALAPAPRPDAADEASNAPDEASAERSTADSPPGAQSRPT